MTPDDLAEARLDLDTAECKRQARLACAQLAIRTHAEGLADDGATVMETARQLAEFVEEPVERVAYSLPGGIIVTTPVGTDPRSVL
ncbi:hypothetical protein SEA_MARSHAWN_1 [Mycobacterium phage Marshawn]|uniref:Gene 1 ring forming protein domain-containing protein n=1 Tax=Mycobacterium phage Marshawn TaxID=2652423 RepID=A0A5P8D722_9CAUD|nr:hypothetical protein I5H02_gp01 [Mycobacterium phage Marshawn]QFP94788.1 hypothetical protein SEA_MARSHAWN_1 [Mycobacterium phage Marshawn]